MQKYESWIIALFVLVFIALPSLVGLFITIDNRTLAYFYMPLIGIGVVFGGWLVTYFFYRLKIFGIHAFGFSLPVATVCALLFIARDMPWWAMLLLALVGVFTTIPVRMVLSFLEDRKRQKAALRLKSESSK